MKAAKDALAKKNQKQVMMIDCSHGNSKKDHKNQPLVAKNIADQLRQGESGIVAVMIESNVIEGSQKVTSDGSATLKKGVSITDACIGWDTTVKVLTQLAEAVRARRELKAKTASGSNGQY